MRMISSRLSSLTADRDEEMKQHLPASCLSAGSRGQRRQGLKLSRVAVNVVYNHLLYIALHWFDGR
jgi:hypothetical protein